MGKKHAPHRYFCPVFTFHRSAHSIQTIKTKVCNAKDLSTCLFAAFEYIRQTDYVALNHMNWF